MPDLASLFGNADEFPILRKWNYLNHAGVAPLPRVVAGAVRRFTDGAATDAYLDSDWFGDMDRGRAAVAALIGADSAEVALVKNTSEAISTIAFGLSWQPGDRVVTPACEYPANIYPWMELGRRHGVALVTVPEETGEDGRRRVPVEKLLAALDHPKTKLLTLSHVQYASGQRFDLRAIGAVCRAGGILFNVDGIQSLGVLPVDVRGMSIDFLGACGHKWMCGPTGAGFLYVRKELLDRVRPLLVGANTVVNFLDYGNIDYTLRPDAGRYESGTPNLAGIAGLAAAVGLLSSVGIEPIAARVKLLTDRLIDGLELKGYQIVSPRTGDEWSGMVNFVSPRGDHAALQAMLRKDHQIEIIEREKRLRASPHFYNTEAQVDELVGAL